MRFVQAAVYSAVILPLLAGNQAFAGGFMVRENSAESLGMVYAGDASRADEAATVFDNPAGMMHLAGPEVELGAAVVFPSIHFVDGAAKAAGTIPISGDLGGQAGQIAGIPHFYAVFDISDNLRAGLAVTAPFGNETNYGPGFVGRYQGIKTLALSADINPNIAWRINNMVSIGGGISAQWLKVEQSAAIPQFLILQNPVPDASFLFNAHGWGVGYNAGLLLEPNTTTRLGFTYRSGIDHKLSGSLDFTGVAPVLPLMSGPATGSGLNLPGTAAVSFTHDWSASWSGSAELQYNMWSSFKNVVVTSANPDLSEAEHYRDSWMITAGATYHATQQLALRAGFGWDQTPVLNGFRTVGIPDANRLMIGAGAGYTVAPGIVVDLGYAHYWGASNPPIDGSVNALDPFTHAIALTGTYHNFLDYVALSVRYAL